jgi:hypothetical protein
MYGMLVGGGEPTEFILLKQFVFSVILICDETERIGLLQLTSEF